MQMIQLKRTGVTAMLEGKGEEVGRNYCDRKIISTERNFVRRRGEPVREGDDRQKGLTQKEKTKQRIRRKRRGGNSLLPSILRFRHQFARKREKKRFSRHRLLRRGRHTTRAEDPGTKRRETLLSPSDESTRVDVAIEKASHSEGTIVVGNARKKYWPQQRELNPAEIPTKSRAFHEEGRKACEAAEEGWPVSLQSPVQSTGRKRKEGSPII